MTIRRGGMLASSLFWLAVTGFGVYFLYNLKAKKFVKFGIDLVGGTYLTLDVKVEEALKNELHMQLDRVIATMAADGKGKIDAEIVLDEKTGSSGKVTFATSEVAQNAVETTKRLYPALKVSRDNNAVTYAISDEVRQQIIAQTVKNNTDILKQRLDVYGAGETTVERKGERSILVELPDVSDPEQAKARIGTSALLEMKPIYDAARSKEKLLEKLGGSVPPGTQIVENNTKTQAVLAPNYAKLTGRMLVSAEGVYVPLRQDETRSPYVVSFTFNNEGARLFYELTKENVGGQIGVIIDDELVSAAAVSKPIDSVSAQIEGSFTEDEAKELALMLKSGAYAAPVSFVEERHIGPSLGRQAIEKGLRACVIGLAALAIFSVLVYKMAGVFAFIVLLYNLLFVLFGLYLVDGTLTLPGIGGMVLTLGMAIDSSILIYERIKEELANGISLRQAIDNGFNDAFTVILDSNITTFLVGAVLYYFGSPAIRGFAVTMMIGIVSTLIAGLVLLRWIFKFFLNGLQVKRISF